MEIRFTTINCTLGIRQHTFILLQFVQEWKDENDKKKKKENTGKKGKLALQKLFNIVLWNREYQVVILANVNTI